MQNATQWREYARLQERTDRRKLDANAWIAEDQANEFLAALEKGRLSQSPGARGIWLDNLRANRGKKHRRRAALLHQYQHERPDSQRSLAEQIAIHNETLSRVRESTTAQEWMILVAVAAGQDYRSIAVAIGCSDSALKTRISRSRKRLSRSCA
jgi:hypothetical protein